MHTCVYISHLVPQVKSCYEVEVCSTNGLYEVMTIDYVKIKNDLILRIVFSSCMLQNHDTEGHSISDELKYRKKTILQILTV